MDGSRAITAARDLAAKGRAWPRVQVIVNPIAGRRRRDLVVESLALLRARGLEVVERDTAGPDHARSLARAAAEEPGGLVVAAGGDGTINEAANGLFEAAVATGRRLPLAILPLGTANVLAHEIGLPLRADAVARTVAEGPPMPITLGRATPGGGAPRCFVLMAGVGFDAHVVEGISPALKRWLGKGAYVWESLRQLALFDVPRYRVEIDGVTQSAASVIVANARCYAGRYVVAPRAGLAEPGFEVLLFGRGGRLAVARSGLALLRDRLSALPEVELRNARRLRIEGPAGDPVQGDGDTLERLPIDIEAMPEAIDLVMPPGR